MIEPLTAATENTLAFRLSGTLHDADYKFFVPRVEKAIEEHGTIRLLAQLDDFHGWDAHALWDDIKFGVQHARGIERIAIVGEKNWEEWMATICRCFTKAEVRYFDISEVESAWEWLGEDQSPALTVTRNSFYQQTGDNNMAMESLIDGLDSDDPIIRQTSRHRLVQQAPESVEPLVTLLRSLNRHLRWEAAKALASIADPSTIPALVRALEDSDGGVRWDVAVALVNIGKPSVEPILQAIIHRSKDGLILEGAQHVVHELSHTPWGAFLHPVYEAFEASHPEVSAPVAADAALMFWRSNRAKPALDHAASC